MPRRGPPPRTTSSHEAGVGTDALGSRRAAEFAVVTSAVEMPFSFFNVVVQPVARKQAEFAVVVHPVERKQAEFAVVTNAVEVVDNGPGSASIEREAFKVVTRALPPTGYPSPARLSSFRTVPVGPVVRRPAEVIPPAE